MKQQHFSTSGIELVVVGPATLLDAQNRVTGCRACTTLATRSFESLLHMVSGTNGEKEYFLGFPTQCPKCSAPIFERTLVDFSGDQPDDDWAYFDIYDEDQNVIFIDEATLLDAEGFVAACENCCERAEVPFDQLLDAITGCDPRITEYVICHPAKCGFCRQEIVEKTLIVPR